VKPVLASMTGVGVAAGLTDAGHTTVEARSLNGRGLVVKLRLAAELHGLEAAVEAAVRSELKRGSVTVTIATSPLAAPQIDEAAVARAVEELKRVQQRFALAGELDLRTVLSFPGVLAATAAGPRAGGQPSAELAALLQQALQRLVQHRQAEGRLIGDSVAGLFAELEALQRSVQQRLPGVARAYRERLLKRVNEFLAGSGRALADGDVVREVALFAERADVSEEIGRMQIHLARCRELLALGGEVGRNLEFLLQELLREANTIASKASDAEVAHLVVAMKSSIDKLKEQVGNLE
jgi:uncharacterized protein (TIGR00255 family)